MTQRRRQAIQQESTFKEDIYRRHANDGHDFQIHHCQFKGATIIILMVYKTQEITNVSTVCVEIKS